MYPQPWHTQSLPSSLANAGLGFLPVAEVKGFEGVIVESRAHGDGVQARGLGARAGGDADLSLAPTEGFGGARGVSARST